MQGNIFHFQKYDAKVSTAVQESVKRHMWYLSEELVVFALYDDHADDQSKLAIASALRQCGRPEQFKSQRPKFKPNQLTENTCLSELVGER